MSKYPCLRAEMNGGAYVHERWDGLNGARLVALCESEWTAITLAKALAAGDANDQRSWVVTDSQGSDQQAWNRARLEADAVKAEGR